MNAWLLVNALGLWALSFCGGMWKWAFLCGFCLYILFRFRCLRMLILSVALLGPGILIQQNALQRAQQEPSAGPYRITEVRKAYCVASNNSSSVLVYGLEDGNFGQIWQLDCFEPVYSLKNEPLFAFESFAKGRGLYFVCQAEHARLLRQSTSLQSRMFANLRQNELTAYLFYSISLEDQQDWISSLGLPFAGALGLVQRLLQRKFKPEQARVICLVICVLYGHFFFWSLSLARIFIFRLAGLLPDWNRRWSLEVMLFLILFPLAYGEFCLVLPALMSFAGRFSRGSVKKAVQIVLCAGLQALYFGKVDLVLIFGFGLLRQGAALCFLMGVVYALLPADTVLKVCLEQLIRRILSCSVSGWCWWGKPAVLVTVLFACALIYVLMKPSRRSLLSLLFVCVLYPASFYLNPFFQVWQLDIGQGDCCVIAEPFMKSVVMIDAAGSMTKDNAKEIIIPFLRSQHFMQIDALLITHADFDHSGSAESLNEHWNVRQMITQSVQKVPVRYPFALLLPEREAKDENDKSLVSFFAYDGFSYLWTGDASAEIEKQILAQYNVNCDVLKAGHHGSATSSCQEFLEAASARLSLISCGYKNRYNHPSPEVIRRMHALGTHTLDTSKDGSIHLQSWRGWMHITSGSGLSAWIQAAPVEDGGSLNSIAALSSASESLVSDSLSSDNPGSDRSRTRQPWI